MNSLLVRVTDSGWEELCKPTDRLQRGKNWQSLAVQNAISPSHCLSYVGNKTMHGY